MNIESYGEHERFAIFHICSRLRFMCRIGLLHRMVALPCTLMILK